MSEDPEPTSQRVGTTADVKEDSPYVTSVSGQKIAVFNVEGEYFALDNQCPHQGGPLGDGKVEDGCVYCPWHGWEFDIESGEHVQGTERATRYEVSVEGDDIYVAL